MYHSVLELGQFGAVPTSCCTYKVACDSLELVDLCALAVRTLLKILVIILKSSVHATVAVVVY